MIKACKEIRTKKKKVRKYLSNNTNSLSSQAKSLLTDTKQGSQKFGKIHPGIKNLIEEITKTRTTQTGKTRFFQNNWLKLTQDKFIIETISGLVIPLVGIPIQRTKPKQMTFNSTMKALIRAEIRTLLEEGAVKRVLSTEGQFLSALFVREKKELGK